MPELSDETILEHALKLDHENDDLWTGDGLPRVDVLQHLTGDASLTRADINRAAPDCRRIIVTDPETGSAPDYSVEMEFKGFLVVFGATPANKGPRDTLEAIYPQCASDDADGRYRFADGAPCCLEELEERQNRLAEIRSAANEELTRLAALQESFYKNDRRDEHHQRHRENLALYYQRVAEANERRAAQIERYRDMDLPPAIARAVGIKTRPRTISEERGRIDQKLGQRRPTDRPTMLGG